jgi:hypothetical protein
VVASFLEDVQAGGLLREYLRLAQLAWRSGVTLFVHGGVADESLGFVPGEAHTPDLDDWIARLNAFHARQIEAFVEEPHADPNAAGWGEIVRYQAPVPGTRLNQASVVYGRPADENNHPLLPSATARAALARAGVHRVVVGHTPTGDCPSVVRDEAGFELVLGDNSYGRLEASAKILVRDDDLEVHGSAELDDGRRVEVGFVLARGDATAPIGRQLASGQLVKARLRSGELLLFRGLPERRVEQLAVSDDRLARESG